MRKICALKNDVCFFNFFNYYLLRTKVEFHRKVYVQASFPMKTTPAVQNEMVYTIFPLSLAEGIKRHSILICFLISLPFFVCK